MLVFALVVVAVALVLMGWIVGHFSASRRNKAAQTSTGARTSGTGTQPTQLS